MDKLKYPTILIILIMVLSLAGVSMKVSARPLAATSPALVALLNYSVLGGTAVTNTGTTNTNGAVGVSPGTSITGGVLNAGGGLHSNDASAIAAQNEVTNVTTGIWGALDQGCDFTYGAQDLTLLSPLGPGVYCSTSSFSLTGNLTLTGSGVYIFKTVSTLITSPGSSVTGGDPCNVWWRIGSSVTLDTTTAFIGNIFALNGVNAMNTGATLNGRLLTLAAGTVTLQSNTISGPTCATTTTTALSAGSITTGGSAYDTATLTGANSSTAGGTVTYNVYSDIACTSLAQSSGSLPVISGALPNSNSLTFSSAGTYYWRAAYSGDSLHQASTSVCGAEVLTVSSTPLSLPVTGFAPNRVTVLPDQSADKAYAAMGDLWLEIPRLGVQMNIVGVPETGGTWDVSWLGKKAGWLNGSAFPTWAGNSVLTGHVWNADNTVGPFRYINTLWWGDKVIVHAWGAKYVYEVRSVTQVGPGNTAAMMKHETIPWVTLVTCRGYDQVSDSYKYRVLVRAVLIEVK